MMPLLEPEIIYTISNQNQDIEFLLLERLIKYSLLEYTTLFQYIHHINNQINKLDIVHCIYIFDNDEYITNKWFVNNIRKFLKLRNENYMTTVTTHITPTMVTDEHIKKYTIDQTLEQAKFIIYNTIHIVHIVYNIL